MALGGQLKWDISIDNGSNGLYVSDFHITPISRRVPYNRYAHDHLLNYSHLENIKSFYKDIEGSFYQPFADPILTNEQPYLYHPSIGHESIDLHDGTFDMGVQRAQYSVYGKEFEAFCPVWLEDMYDGDSVKPLTFSFYLRNKTVDGRFVDLAVKHLTLDFSKASEDNTHTRFLRYLNDYIKSIQLDDRLIKIDFDKTSGVMTGVDALTGLVKTIDISNLTKDILAQERILMETDSMILDRFATNHMIAKQLFNFNFVFDIEEFFNQQVLSMMKSSSLYLDIRVKVSDNELEIKDFYTNYDTVFKNRVPDLVTSDVQSHDISIFSDLLDDTDVDIVAKNKMTQTICHWSLADNNDYIFNLYDGFAGYVMTLDEHSLACPTHLTKVNQSAPDIWSDKQVDALNNIGWLNIGKIYSWQEYLNVEQNIDDWVDQSSPIDNWINMCRYDNECVGKLKEYVDHAIIVLVDSSKSNSYTADICWGKVNVSASSHTRGEIATLPTGAGRCIVVRYIASVKLLMLITRQTETESVDGLTFAGFQKLIANMDKDSILDRLKKMMDSASQPKVITFDKILGYMRADGPMIKTTEVSHYKIKSTKKLFRLDGYIKPTFVSPIKNQMYTKKCYTNDADFAKSSFAKYTKTGYPTHYPSKHYFPFNKWSLILNPYDATGRVISNMGNVYSQGRPYEYKWFTLSKIIVLDKQMNLRLESHDDKSVKELILDYIKEKYSTTSDGQAYYIYDQYNMTYDWEYLSPTEIDKYIYTIKLVLK